MAVVLGLLVAVTYGTADFFGGIASKKNHSTVVVALSQGLGLAALAVVVAIDRGAHPIRHDLLAGGAAGSAGLVGLILLYRGLANGNMSVVAPITAVGAGIVPLAWGLTSGERPSAVALGGVATALVAVALVSAADVATTKNASRDDVVLALSAGVAFGVVFILLGTTHAASGMWPVLTARIASVVIVSSSLLVARRPVRPAPGTLPTIVAAGILDVGANALYVLASRRGLLSLVAVLSSLYPAATIILARLVLAERMNRKQLLGIVLALTGVTLIAAG